MSFHPRCPSARRTKPVSRPGRHEHHPRCRAATSRSASTPRADFCSSPRSSCLLRLFLQRPLSRLRWPPRVTRSARRAFPPQDCLRRPIQYEDSLANQNQSSRHAPSRRVSCLCSVSSVSALTDRSACLLLEPGMSLNSMASTQDPFYAVRE